MGWVISLIISIVLGWLAKLVLKTNAQVSLITNILVSVTGTLPGFWSAGQ